MYRIRSKFCKTGDMIFISHLDLVRVFERAFRRARIPISYTQGFNPHPIMAFATALGIGVSSEGEYMDIQIDKKMDLVEFVEQLNNVLPKGLKIIESQYISKNEDSLMAIIRFSSYIVKVMLNDEIQENEIKDKLNIFLNLQEIIEIKEKKKSCKKFRKSQVEKVNILPYIKGINIIKIENNQMILKMLLATGSKGNLKPETVIKKLKEEINIPIDVNKIKIHRVELFKQIEPYYLTPLDDINKY